MARARSSTRLSKKFDESDAKLLDWQIFAETKNHPRENGPMDFDGQAERLGLDTIGTWSGSLA